MCQYISDEVSAWLISYSNSKPKIIPIDCSCNQLLLWHTETKKYPKYCLIILKSSPKAKRNSLCHFQTNPNPGSFKVILILTTVNAQKPNSQWAPIPAMKDFTNSALFINQPLPNSTTFRNYKIPGSLSYDNLTYQIQYQH